MHRDLRAQPRLAFGALLLASARDLGDAVRGPPAYVLLASCDVLRDEGVAYARALKSAGIETVVDEVSGVPHVFLSFQGLAVAQAAVQRVAAWLEARW